jgi:hypothetical protein
MYSTTEVVIPDGFLSSRKPLAVTTKLLPDPNGNNVPRRANNNNDHYKTWFAGFYSCFQPILDRMQWAKTLPVDERLCSSEIKFEDLHSLEYLASGAQGLVYKGNIRHPLYPKRLYHTNNNHSYISCAFFSSKTVA